jgi:uncharacterized protein YcbK (DUF882 family)
MQLTENFNIDEFACKDGTPVTDCLIDNVEELALNLQVIRDFCACPINILSGYRTPEHNKNVGGAKNSQHLLGKAGDLMTTEYTSKELYHIIKELISIGAVKEGGLGYYDTFVHYDIRGTKARW